MEEDVDSSEYDIDWGKKQFRVSEKNVNLIADILSSGTANERTLLNHLTKNLFKYKLSMKAVKAWVRDFPLTSTPNRTVDSITRATKLLVKMNTMIRYGNMPNLGNLIPMMAPLMKGSPDHRRYRR